MNQDRINRKSPQEAAGKAPIGENQSPNRNKKDGPTDLIMRPLIESVVGTLGPGEFRFFESVYNQVNEDVRITRMHLKDLLSKLDYGVQEGTYAQKKTFTVEGGPIEEPEWIPPKPIQNGEGVFKHFNTAFPLSGAYTLDSQAYKDAKAAENKA